MILSREFWQESFDFWNGMLKNMVGEERSATARIICRNVESADKELKEWTEEETIIDESQIKMEELFDGKDSIH